MKVRGLLGVPRLLPLLALLVFGGGWSCGKLVTSVPFSALGTTTEAAVQIAAGTRLTFPVYAKEYSYSGSGYLLIDVELVRDGAVVDRMSCRGFEFEGEAGGGCQTTHDNAECTMTVPAGGAQAVRVAARLERPATSARLDGLAVEVRSH